MRNTDGAMPWNLIKYIRYVHFNVNEEFDVVQIVHKTILELFVPLNIIVYKYSNRRFNLRIVSETTY